MNSKILLLIMLLVSCFIFSQSIAKLKTETQKIYDAYYTMDFETVTQLSYPKMVTQFGKEKWVEKLDFDYQNDETRMRLQLVSPVFTFGTVQQIEGIATSIVSYKNPIRYFFEKKLNATSADQKAKMLQEINLTKDVTFEPKRNSFNVRRHSKLIAIIDESTSGEWRFFNWDDPKQRELFETIFGVALKKQLGL